MKSPFDVGLLWSFVLCLATPLYAQASPQLSVTGLQPGDAFGHSMVHDETALLVGAPFTDSAGVADTGMVHVYVNNQGDWDPAFTLSQPTPYNNALFGRSVALQDGHAYVAGRQLNQNGFLTGVVHVYDRSLTPWPLVQTLIINDDHPDDGFGQSIAVEDDVLVITGMVAPDLRNVAHIYERNNGLWQWVDAVRDARSPNTFGQGLVVSDGRIIIGSPDLNFQGSVYVFEKTGQNYQLVQELRELNTISLGRFGYDVSAHGNRLLVGMPRFNGTGIYSFEGRAFLYEHNGSEYVLQDELSPHDIKPQDYFGYQVHLSADQAVISAVFDDDDGIDSGSIYVFRSVAGQWEQSVKVNTNSDQANQKLGASLAFSNPVLLAGAPMNNEMGMYAGAVFIHDIDLIYRSGFQAGEQP